jgi:hypothetical protein
LDQPFVLRSRRPEDYWRGVILFGRNVATYKFALGRALLDLKPAPGQLLTLEELATPFASHLCAHLLIADKQGTFESSRFLKACRAANAGELTQPQLVEKTVRLGFNNVIDAFHFVGGKEIPERFFLDERRTEKGIRVTKAFAALLEGSQGLNLPLETDARWKLVETAWQRGLAPALLDVGHDPDTESLFVVDSERKRKSITGARDALSGYQKGHCFYCFDEYSLAGSDLPDVDHFFPHKLKTVWRSAHLDGIWNLVLACRRCNRGLSGKSAHIPTLKLLERLSTRNEFLIDSHHPLRETLIAQTGASKAERRSFLNARHVEARALLLHEWAADEVCEALF